YRARRVAPTWTPMIYGPRPTPLALQGNETALGHWRRELAVVGALRLFLQIPSRTVSVPVCH
ncbi:MAG: hypothetical protein ACXVBY_11135, partial [Isosphaeraceae bacterium]